MRIITCNVNGIRSAAKKGFFEWIEKQNADFICLQETKAQLEKLEDPALQLTGYHRFVSDALKPGYSGVAVYAKAEPKVITKCLGWNCADEEGRYLQLDFNKFSIASLYLPSGTSGEARQTLKFEFLDRYLPTLQNIIQSQRPFIICGDWNIAHKPIDLKNWRANQKNSGFLPEERAWLDKVLDELGWVDAFRVVNQEADQYTWWSARGNARANNVGWRIDYQIVSQNLKNSINKASIYKEKYFSDHAPLIIDYEDLMFC